MVDMRKCAVIGCGNVGASTAFTLMQHGMFSEMVLIDIDQKRAQGEAMDLSHGLPFASPMQVWAGEYSDLCGCGLIIISAGAKQNPGETRIDLLNRNAAIMRSMIPQITKYNQEAILLIISNPVDILTSMALRISGFPANRVIGSGTVLDTARLKYLLGQRLHVDPRNIHAFIIGEHGDSELAVWSSANVSGIDLCDYADIVGQPMQELYPLYDEVKNSAYRVIEGKGATYYGIAMSVLRIVQAIVRDEHAVLPVSSCMQGHYGADGMCIGVPSIVGAGGIERVLDIPLSAKEQGYLDVSVNKLREVMEQIQW